MSEQPGQPLSYAPPRKTRGVLSTAIVGAVLLGGIGFVGGYVGPIVFTPEANQGPLLGIFVTGPLGVVIGFVGGLLVGVLSRRARKTSAGFVRDVLKP